MEELNNEQEAPKKRKPRAKKSEVKKHYDILVKLQKECRENKDVKHVGLYKHLDRELQKLIKYTRVKAGIND